MVQSLTPELIEQAAQVAPDQTLATAFAPPNARPALIVLTLFAHEIGRARQAVSEPMLAAIRLQWWRDALEEIYSGKAVRRQPVAQALADAIRAHDLPRASFDAMIDAYEAEQVEQPFATWADLEAHCDASFGNYNRLALLICGAPAISTQLDDIARGAAIAWRIGALMRDLPLWSLRRSLWLPAEAIAGNEAELVFAGTHTTHLKTCLKTAADRIDTARIVARKALKNAAIGSSFCVISYAGLARPYGQRVLKLADPFREPVSISLLEKQLRLVAAVATQRI